MSPRLRRWLIVLGVLLLLGIAFVWSLPEIVKWQALKQIPAITGRQASIDDIDVNLFTGRVAIKKFRLAEADPGQTFVEFERLDVRVIPWSGIFGNVRVAEFRLTAPTVNLVRESATEFNFSDILRRLAASKEGAPPPPPPDTHWFWRSRGSVARAATVLRSATEWQLAHRDATYDCPAAALPISACSGATCSPSGGRPWLPACPSTLCRYSAIAVMSAGGSGKAGIGGAPAGGLGRPPVTIGAMSSPALSDNSVCERSRLGPPCCPPRRSMP